MSYLIQARLARDPHIIDRVAACAAIEGQNAPQDWAFARQWILSAQPGWVDAYRYALDSGDDQPGANEAAITDQMVLSAVQALLGVEPDPEPVPGPDPEPELPDEPEDDGEEPEIGDVEPGVEPEDERDIPDEPVEPEMESPELDEPDEEEE